LREKMSAKPTDEGSARQRLAARPLAPNPSPARGGGRVQRLDAVCSAESAVDLMEASCFRSFAAVNGLRPPEAARKARH
jgi:hypothetical protein